LVRTPARQETVSASLVLLLTDKPYVVYFPDATSALPIDVPATPLEPAAADKGAAPLPVMFDQRLHRDYEQILSHQPVACPASAKMPVNQLKSTLRDYRSPANRVPE